MSRIDKMVWDQFQLDPTENGRAHRIAKMIKEGKISLGGGGATMTAFWREQSERYQEMFEESQKDVEALRKKTLAKSRNKFIDDDRMLIWRYAITQALSAGTNRHDANGFRIGWAQRLFAIRVFTENLWKFREVKADTLREITLRAHASAKKGYRPDIEDLLQPMAERSKRSGPPHQDWTALRDRLEVAA